jgi:hypothetical protein
MFFFFFSFRFVLFLLLFHFDFWLHPVSRIVSRCRRRRRRRLSPWVPSPRPSSLSNLDYLSVGTTFFLFLYVYLFYYIFWFDFWFFSKHFDDPRHQPAEVNIRVPLVIHVEPRATGPVGWTHVHSSIILSSSTRAEET